jgi:DNA adenine methylase
MPKILYSKPFLKWAGGKTRVLKHIFSFLPKGERLVEPFCGSGAVFLNTDYREYLVSDINSDLINIFNFLKEEDKYFIDYCKSFFTPSNNTQDKYTELRNLFNSAKDTRIKSALFIYLNRHGFNGLCRYNSTGGFNVPFGRYTKPYFPEKEMLLFQKKAKTVTFLSCDFRTITAYLKVGDVVYCDPPYVPLTATASFTSYSKDSFGSKDQLDLSKWAEDSMKKGIPVLLSNHDTPVSREAYKNASRIKAFKVQRHISCDGKNRKSVKELLALYSRESV